MNRYIDPECLCALILAIVNPRPLSSEQAFAKLRDPNNFFSSRTSIEDILLLKKAGSTWREINKLLGCKNAQSTYCNYISRKKKKRRTKHES